MKPQPEPWFAIRRELKPARAAILKTCSFLLPLAIWCVVSYVPFIWHPDVKLDLGAAGATIYTAGDHVGKDYFPTLQTTVREENAIVETAIKAGEPLQGSSRTNIKTLRQLAPLAIKQGMLAEDGATNDAAIYELWKQVASGKIVFTKPGLTAENLIIAKSNWKILERYSPVYDKTAFPKEKLLSLIPQGKPANPVYLPAPHEVFQTGIREWQSVPEEGKPSMSDRLRQSIGVVFGGFLLASLIALPLGILAGTYDFFSKLTEPFLDFFRYMPAPAFATLLVAVLGAHSYPKLALVLIGTFPHLFLMLSKTTRLLDRSLIEAGQTLGAQRTVLLGKVVIPGILPSIYNDLRIALGWAWTWLVIAELIGVKSGLTEVIDTQGVRRNFDRVFPVIILIGVIGFTTDQILAWLRPRLFRWTERPRPGLIGKTIGSFITWITPQIDTSR